MISYYEGGIKKTKEGYPISLKILQSLIKSNPNAGEIEQLRSLEYGSSEYKNFKVTNPFPCCKPHGIFNNMYSSNLKKNTEVLLKLSGYLYFDIDCSGVPTQYRTCIEEYKTYVSLTYSSYISMLGKSIGGKGIFFLVKVKNLTEDNFLSVYDSLRTGVFKDLAIDNNAKGIARNFFIPSDTNLYVNDKVEVTVKEIIQNAKWSVGSIKSNTKLKKDALPGTNPGSCHASSYMPIGDLFNILNLKTYVDTNGRDVLVEPVECIKCFVPKKIFNNTKHKTFRTMTNVLVHLNPGIPVYYIKSFIWWINQNYTCGTPMVQREMESIVQWAYEDSIKNGLWEGSAKWLKTKYIHRHKDDKKTPEQRRIEGVALYNEWKIKKTLAILEDAISELRYFGEEVRICNVVKKLKGIRGASTIKKYWNFVNAAQGCVVSEPTNESITSVMLPVLPAGTNKTIQLPTLKSVVPAPENSLQQQSTIQIDCQQ